MDEHHIESIPAHPIIGRIYQHYKGDYYLVLAKSRLSEQRDTWVVLYESLKFGHQWTRPLNIFNELVLWHENQWNPRFKLVELLHKEFSRRQDFPKEAIELLFRWYAANVNTP